MPADFAPLPLPPHRAIHDSHRPHAKDSLFLPRFQKLRIEELSLRLELRILPFRLLHELSVKSRCLRLELMIVPGSHRQDVNDQCHDRGEKAERRDRKPAW